METACGKKYKGVIFDMDGVIFDSEALWKEAFELANIKFGLEFTEEYRQSCCGRDERSIRNELRVIHPGLDADEYRDFMNCHVREAIEREGAPLKEGFCELAQFLKESGFKTALATSSVKARAERLFGKANLDMCGLFDGTVFAEEVKISKPDPQIFLCAAGKIGVSPADCIVLEDSLNGIKAAKSGGFAPVMVVDLIEPDEAAKNSCILVARSLTEVTKFLAARGEE